MSTYLEGELVNARGQKLFTVHYAPASGAPKALILFHHGYGEHVGRYKPVFTSLAEAGFAVHSYDAHGHGKSEPKEESSRALVWSFDHLIEDYYHHRAAVAKQYPSGLPPCYAMGQSMGGLVICRALLQQQELWAGIILHSALVDVEWTPVLKVQAAVGNIIATLLPRARIVPAVNPSDMSVDPAVVEHYINDPLNFVGNLRSRTGNENLKAFRQLASQEHLIKVPIYACHGSNDVTTSLPAVQRLVKNAQSQDKTVKVIEGAKHELLMGPEREESVASIIAWLNGQLAKPKL